MIGERQGLRIGATCAFLFSLLSIAGPMYLNTLLHGDTYPDSTKLSTNAFLAKLLPFAHAHQDLWIWQAITSSISYLVLCGVIYGAALLVRRWQPGAAQLSLIVGLLSVTLSVIVQIAETHRLLDYAQRFVQASAAGRATVIQGFKASDATQIVALVSANGLAIWLAILGIALLRQRGNGNLAGWITIGVGVLSVLNLPLLLFWCLGAGAYLWRASEAPVPTATIEGQVVEPAFSDADGTGEGRATGEAGMASRERAQMSSAGRRARQRSLAARGSARRKRR